MADSINLNDNWGPTARRYLEAVGSTAEATTFDNDPVKAGQKYLESNPSTSGKSDAQWKHDEISKHADDIRKMLDTSTYLR